MLIFVIGSVLGDGGGGVWGIYLSVSPRLFHQDWKTCKQDEWKPEVMRNESFHIVASQGEAATQAPALSPWTYSFSSTPSDLQPGMPASLGSP